MDLTEKEKELIEMIRNFRNSKHNYSIDLELDIRDLFEQLLIDDDSKKD